MNITKYFRANLALILCHVIFICGCELPADVVTKVQHVEKTANRPLVDSSSEDPESKAFTEKVREIMKKRDFEALNAYGKELSEKKERFTGGSWKIFSFDILAASPLVDSPNDSDWESHLLFVREWTETMPKSIIARTALANTNLNYAWEARGSGYSNSISLENRKLVDARMQKALKEIELASILDERYHGYFSSLLKIANASGFETDEFKNIFNSAVNYDETYQYSYTQMATYLLPRWNGKPGDWEDFADKVKVNLGRIEGLKMYYLIVVEMGGMHGNDFFDIHRVSWEDTKKGFELYEKNYGMSRRKLNQFGSLARHAKDAQMGCKIFNRLKGEDDFEPAVWTNRGTFEAYKATALSLCKNTKIQ